MGKGMGSTGFARSARYKAKVAANEGREAAGRAYGTGQMPAPKLARFFFSPPRAFVQHPPIEPAPVSPNAAATAAIYAVAFVTGAIVMSFEMLGSR